VRNNVWVLVGKILNRSTSFMLESYTDSASKVPWNDLEQIFALNQRFWQLNWQQSLQIHISQNIKPKLANKYSLERYLKYLQLLFQNPTQLRHVRSLKTTLNMYCMNWSENRALELDSNLRKDITQVLLNKQMLMIILWKGQETYYNIFHRVVNRFDL
jgi:hypothetical protein